MGLKNPRAICPNCGGKIHTQSKGLVGGHRTGRVCELCGVRLTGEVKRTSTFATTFRGVLAPEREERP